ncbi:helix-turn-helix domain-containing protein [Endozoicomonas numazuensis]|uniref:helix-turn-helix domain-containing protein n=1 Tax=Endozoicomonas numazuensis TaxID=1137799 RepID=UPI000B0B90FB|nr:helix-turn-helix domain-containing protein [Endozoicomonas numazuensis]
MQDSVPGAVAPTLCPTPETRVAHLDSLQLSRRLNISIKSLARMRQDGTGPRFMRIGSKILYRLSDVLEYEQSRLYNAVGSPVVDQEGES